MDFPIVFETVCSPVSELWAKMSFLYPKVMSALPANHPCHQAFSAFKKAEDELPDNAEMPVLSLTRANGAYLRLSGADMAKVMNGWSLGRERPTRIEQIRRADMGGMIHKCITMHASSDQSLAVYPDTVSGDSNHAPVTIQILEGTSKHEAMQLLTEMLRMVDTWWGSLVSGSTMLRDQRGDMARMIDPIEAAAQLPVTLQPGQQDESKVTEAAAA